MLNKERTRGKVLHSSDRVRSCMISETLTRRSDATKSAGVFGGAGLAHGPVLAESANYSLSSSSHLH